MPKREAVATSKNKSALAPQAQAEQAPVVEYTPALPTLLAPSAHPTQQVVHTHATVIARAAHTHPTLAQRPLLQLQQQYGNQHVQRVLALARQAADNAPVEPNVEQDIEQARNGGQALDRGVRGQMESAFGADFSGVRVHTDRRADGLNQALNARAFTTGGDIFFRQGAYSPGSSTGRELLAHELTHVVQQTGATHAKLVVNQPGDRFEQEADQAARAVIQREQQPNLVQRQAEEEEPLQTKRLQRQMEEDEPVQAKLVQRQPKEEEPVQTKRLQRQTEEEQPVQTQSLQRQMEEDKPLQTRRLQRQMEEDKPVQAKFVQRQPEEDKQVQTKRLQRQTEEEQPVQAKLVQRQPEEDEPVQTKRLQRQAEQEEPIQTKFLLRQTEEEQPIQTKRLNRQPVEAKKAVQPRLIQRRKTAYTRPVTLAYREGDEAAEAEPTEAEKAAALAAARAAEQLAFQSLAEGNNQVVKSQTAETAEENAEKAAQQEAEAQSPALPAEAAYAAAAQPGDETGAAGDAMAGAPPTEMAAGGADASAPPANGAAPTLGIGPVASAGPGATNGKAPATPGEDPDYQAVVKRVKGVANQQQQHAPAKSKADESQAAAESPTSELAGKAQANQVDAMEQAEAPPFDAAAFKAQLMERIAALAPKTVEEADNFKKDNKIGSVKSEMQGRVQEEQSASQAPLAETSAAPPDTSSVEPKPVTPLAPAAPGPEAANVAAAGAAPKSKGQSEVEAPLQENSQKLDQQMADADVTEEQLANSNEPEFQGALGAKQEAQTHAVSAPQEYRQAEGEQLTQAETDAVALAQERTQAMHGDRAQLFGQVAEQQGQTKSADEQARDKVAADIQKIYDETKANVETILNALDGKVETAFDEGAAAAKQVFEDYVEAKMEAYKERRYGGWFGWAKWAKDKLLGMPDEVNAFYADGRNLYLRKMDAVIDNVVAIVGAGITEAKAKIAEGKLKISQYVEQLPEDLKSVGQQAAADIQDKFADLEQSVADKQNELVDTLANKYQENLQAIDARIEELKAANQGLVDKAINAVVGVIKAILKLKDLLLGVLARIADVVGKIIKAPIEFLGNLVKGVKQGFMDFLGNIGKHLQTALVAWLTGALGPMNIQVPDDLFSLSGIFSLVMQVLGLTWDYIRGKAVKLLGEPVVKALETGFEVFQILIRDGVAGLWEFIKDQFTNLKEMVIDQIKEMVISEVIQAGVKWILGLLNPAGAFIKAAMAIYEIVKFFIERGSQIIEMVNAFIDAVAAIAGGAVGGAAKLVENALAKALPVVIGFLASLLGISGLAKKVQKLIMSIRKKIDKAIDKLILKAQKAAKKLLAKGKAALGKEKDVRTDQEKQADLKKASEEAEKVVEDETIPIKQVHKRLKAIRQKYGLTNLLLEQKQQNDKKIIYSITAKINPEVTRDADRENKFAALLYEALKKLGDTYFKGFSKPEIQSGLAAQAGAAVPRGAAATGATEPTPETEDEVLRNARRAREAQVQQEGSRIHQALAKAQIAYSTASKAKFYPNNTFTVGTARFFVEQTSNFYIVPADRAAPVYDYYVKTKRGGQSYRGVKDELTRQSTVLESEIKRINDEAAEKAQRATEGFSKQQGVTEEAIKEFYAARLAQFKKQAEVKEQQKAQIDALIASSDQLARLKALQAEAALHKDVDEADTRVSVPTSLADEYDYGRNPVTVAQSEEFFREFPNSITTTKSATVFVAAVVAEPSRYSVAHITNLLILGAEQKPPAGSNVFESLSMTQKGSDPHGEKSKTFARDPRLIKEGGLRVPEHVTSRDLRAVTESNPTLRNNLQARFDEGGDDGKIVNDFMEMIKKHLNLPSEP